MNRIYLPASAMTSAGVTEATLREATRGHGWERLARSVATRAKEQYAAAEEGIDAIAPARSRIAVRLMRSVYGEILREIERRDFDVFSARVVVPTRTKLWLAARVIAGAERSWRSAS